MGRPTEVGLLLTLVVLFGAMHGARAWTDMDNNGIPDYLERGKFGVTVEEWRECLERDNNFMEIDMDKDGFPDCLDSDVDNDGIPDDDDDDDDGVPDWEDEDDGDDGVPDNEDVDEDDIYLFVLFSTFAFL